MKASRWIMSGGLLGIVACCALLLTAAAPEPPKQISCTDLAAGKTQIIGNLSQPLGTYLTIEGIVVVAKETILTVNAVDGKKLDHPVTLEIRTHLRLPARFTLGTRYVLRGFETGAMTGSPINPEAKPEEKDDRRPQQDQRFRFDCWFQVIEVKSETPAPKAQN